MYFCPVIVPAVWLFLSFTAGLTAICFPLFSDSFSPASLPWHPHPSWELETERERETGNFTLQDVHIFFQTGALSFSLPLQQKQQEAAKCGVNGSIDAAGEERGGSSHHFNNKMPRWTLASHTSLSLDP